MSDYITLLGSEQVQNAARQMQNAADQMQRAASEFSSAVDRQERMLLNWLQDFQAALENITSEKP